MRNFNPRSRAFNERPIKAGQEAFDGGLTLDLPKSKAKASQLTLLENFRNFGEYLEGRGGSINYANVALPAGTPRSRVYNRKLDKLVLHIGAAIYVTSKTLLTYTAGLRNCAAIDDAASCMDIYENWVFIFCNGKLYKMDITAAPYIYYRINTPVVTRKITSVATSATLVYKRRYTTPMVRLAQAGQYSRADLAPDVETGATHYDDGDFGEVATQYQPGVGLYTHDVMYGTELVSPYNAVAGWTSITDGAFKLAVEVTPAVTIGSLNFSACTTLDGVAQVIQAKLRTELSLFRLSMEYDDSGGHNRFILRLYQQDGDIADITAPTSGTDIRAALGLTTAGIVEEYYPESAQMGDLVAPATSDHLTHFGVYSTLDLGANNVDPFNGKVNVDYKYVWQKDVPRAKCFHISQDGHRAYLTGGKFDVADAGCTIELQDGRTITLSSFVGPWDAITTEDAYETLIGGALASPYDAYTGWTSITDGEASFTIDGTTLEVTGIDFSACTSMSTVAATLQLALRTAFGSNAIYCTYDATNGRFKIYKIANDVEMEYAAPISGGAGTDIADPGGLRNGTASIDDSVDAQAGVLGGGTLLVCSQAGYNVTKTVGRAWLAADVGKPVYWQDGTYSLITSRTNDDVVVVADTATRESQAASINPTSRKYNDAVTDDTLRARMKSYYLKTRYWEPLPEADLGAIGGGMIWAADNGGDTVYYSQLVKYFEESAGYYSPESQIEKVKDSITALNSLPLQLDIKCRHSTGAIYYNQITEQQDRDTGEVTVTTGGYFVTNPSVGVLAVHSVVYVPRFGMQVMICADFSLRTYDGNQYSDNLAVEKIQDILKTLDPAKIVACYDDLNGYRFWALQE